MDRQAVGTIGTPSQAEGPIRLVTFGKWGPPQRHTSQRTSTKGEASPDYNIQGRQPPT